MLDFDLDDIKAIRTEAENSGLNLDKHQLQNLVNLFRVNIDYYSKLHAVVVESVSDDYQITLSHVIGPWLKQMVDKLGENVLQGVGEETKEVVDAKIEEED